MNKTKNLQPSLLPSLRPFTPIKPLRPINLITRLPVPPPIIAVDPMIESGRALLVPSVLVPREVRVLFGGNFRRGSQERGEGGLEEPVHGVGFLF